MPRLLDSRLIGFDLGDVQNKTYGGASPGWVLQVAGDGNSMQLAPAPASSNAQQALVARDTERGREGLTFQQNLASFWVDITPASGTLYAQVTGVAYGRGRFVAVGFSSTNTPLIKYSSLRQSGDTWLDVPTVPFAAGTRIFGVRYFDDRFFAFGQNGQLASSVDGIVWTPLSPVNGNIYAAAYGPGVGYVIVGQSNNNNTLGAGVAYFSIDGETFAPITPNPLGTGKIRPDISPVGTSTIDGPIPMYGVTWGQDKFIVVGGEVYNTANGFPFEVNHIAYSSNGSSGSWTVTPSVQPRSSHYTAEFGNGRYLIGTNDGLSTSGGSYNTTIIFSNNGINWLNTTLNPVQTGNVQGIVYGNGVFVATHSAIWLSVDGVNFNRQTAPVTWPGSPPGGGAPPSGTPGAYGNGLFVFGSRGGRIIRSAYGTEVFGAGTGGGSPTAEYVWAIPWDPALTSGSYVINPGDTVSGANLYRFSGDPFAPIGSGTTSTPINEGTWRNVGDRAYSLISTNPTGLQLPPIYQGGLFIRVS